MSSLRQLKATAYFTCCMACKLMQQQQHCQYLVAVRAASSASQLPTGSTAQAWHISTLHSPASKPPGASAEPASASSFSALQAHTKHTLGPSRTSTNCDNTQDAQPQWHLGHTRNCASHQQCCTLQHFSSHPSHRRLLWSSIHRHRTPSAAAALATAGQPAHQQPNTPMAKQLPPAAAFQPVNSSQRRSTLVNIASVDQLVQHLVHALGLLRACQHVQQDACGSARSGAAHIVQRLGVAAVAQEVGCCSQAQRAAHL